MSPVRILWILVLLAVCPPLKAAEWNAQLVPAQERLPQAQRLYYRCFIRVPDNMTSRAAVDLWSDSAMLSFADFPGPFAIFLNGQKIGEGESLPAEPRRRFKIPKGILEKKAFNVLTVRLEKEAAEHGLQAAPVLHGYHDELVLGGTWEFSTGEPAVADFQPLSTEPSRAVFTEAQFRESSTILAANADLVRGQRLPPAESLAHMRTDPRLAVDLLLSEPLVAQPTHFSFDARGRLWVAQYRQYPYPAGLKMISRDKYYRAVFDRIPPAPPHHDRGRDIISVHEDTDGDGQFDRHRNVLTGLNMANAVLHGHGGIWVMHTPYLLFYPDANGDDVPDADPEVRLAGFGLEDTHSVANGLAWGPDGWIYGAQGSTTTSHIRRPGLDAPDAPGVYHESCMIWRYHPDTKVYEIFADGGGNNFGLEFDAEGRLYTGHNGGETRGWHFVQSGIYLKQGKEPGKFGPPTNPFAFGELPMMESSNKITRFSHHFAIAEGAAIPENLQGRLFSADPLHRNIVISERERLGSTLRTSDQGVALESSDPAFRPVFAANAPDGSIYIADFYEEYIAHGQNYQGQIDPDSGRIYRLRGKDASLEKDINLASKTASELVATLSHPSKWHRQTAVRLLGERRDQSVRPALHQLLKSKETHPALEALWALGQSGWLDEQTALSALDHPAALVRAWAIRLMGDRRDLSDQFRLKTIRLAATEPDAEVRCQIASTSRRLSSHQALSLVAALLSRDADAKDPFIPLLCWWSVEAICDTDRGAVLQLFLRDGGTDAGRNSLWQSQMTKQHLLPRLMKRFAMKGTRSDLLVCAQLLEAAKGHDELVPLVAPLVAAFEEAFKGRSLPALPEELVAALAASGQNSLALRVRRSDPEALRQTLALIVDGKAPRAERSLLIRTLGEVRAEGAVQPLMEVAARDHDLELRKAALSSLSNFKEDRIGKEITALYPTLPSGLRPSAQNLLASRPVWSAAFLKLIQQGAVTLDEVAPDALSRIRAHTSGQAKNLAGDRPPRPEIRVELNRIKEILASATGSPYPGEAIFLQRCASCHQFFHKGARIGPNLTPYQRDDLGTMLPAILDPNAEIREGYLNQLIETKDGRTLSGFLVEQDAHVVVVRGLDGEDIAIPRSEISELRASGMSLMPEGLLNGLTDQELRDFFAYLRIPQPISR